MTVSESRLHEAVEQAIEDAYEAYEETTGGFPAGFSWIVDVDGRTSLARFLKQTDLPVELKTNGRTRITIDGITGQSLYPKSEAYRAFQLSLAEEFEEAEDWQVYARWD